VSIDANTLPPGVRFVENYPGYHTQVLLNTSTTTPLYLVVNNELGVHVPVHSDNKATELPENEIPLRKLISDQTYYWNQSNGWKISNSNEGIAFKEIGIETMYKYGDGRPKNTVAPSMQEFSFRAYYGEDPVIIKGKIEYLLNKDYDGTINARGVETCNSWGRAPSIDTGRLLLAVVIAVILLLSPILIYVVMKKRVTNIKLLKYVIIIYTLVVVTILYLVAHATGLIYIM
jgi:hypothetical protein